MTSRTTPTETSSSATQFTAQPPSGLPRPLARVAQAEPASPRIPRSPGSPSLKRLFDITPLPATPISEDEILQATFQRLNHSTKLPREQVSWLDLVLCLENHKRNLTQLPETILAYASDTSKPLQDRISLITTILSNLTNHFKGHQETQIAVLNSITELLFNKPKAFFAAFPQIHEILQITNVSSNSIVSAYSLTTHALLLVYKELPTDIQATLQQYIGKEFEWRFIIHKCLEYYKVYNELSNAPRTPLFHDIQTLFQQQLPKDLQEYALRFLDATEIQIELQYEDAEEETDSEEWTVIPIPLHPDGTPINHSA